MRPGLLRLALGSVDGQGQPVLAFDPRPPALDPADDLGWMFLGHAP